MNGETPPHPARRCPPALVGLAAGMLVATGSHLPAQVVAGTAVDAAGRPIGGAFVLLVDAEGEERNRTLTTASGTFRLSAGRPGTYRLRLERIGFETAASAYFSLTGRETVSRRLEVDSRPVELSALRVPGGWPRCGTPAGEAIELARVWEEARKALRAAAWTAESRAYVFDVLEVRRVTDEDGVSLLAHGYEAVTTRAHGQHPFRAALPSDLAGAAWVQKRPDGALRSFGPDAEVMFSESFLQNHCFGLVRSDTAAGRLVGVGFTPLPGRETTDISGVLWIERSTAALMAVDYRYENAPTPVESDRIGGTIAFDQLPDGGWIVQRWEIRTPRLEAAPPRRGNWASPRQRFRLVGIQGERHEVLAVWRMHPGEDDEPLEEYAVHRVGF